MYKSSAAQQAKDLFSQLRAARQNHALAHEEGNIEDVKGWEERELELTSKSNGCALAGTAPTAPLFQRKISPKSSPCGRGAADATGEEESQRLLKMEEELRRSIIGQEDAILAISRAVRRARAGLKDPKRQSVHLYFWVPRA